MNCPNNSTLLIYQLSLEKSNEWGEIMMAALVFNDLWGLSMKASPMQKCKEMKGNEDERFSNHYPITR